MSKGSGRRPASVTEAEIAANYERIFGVGGDEPSGNGAGEAALAPPLSTPMYQPRFRRSGCELCDSHDRVEKVFCGVEALYNGCYACRAKYDNLNEEERKSAAGGT